METQTCLSKTLTTDDPSRSESVLSQEKLVGFSRVSPLMADSLSGSSSVSRVSVDSLGLDTILENLLEGETVTNPRLSDTPSSDNVSSLTSPPTSPSTESEQSQPLVLVPYGFEKQFNCQEEEEEEDDDDDDDQEEEEEEEEEDDDDEDDQEEGEEEEEEEEEEIPYRRLFSNYNCYYSRRPMVSDQFYVLGENEFKTTRSGYSTWTSWWLKPFSPPKETSRTKDEPTGVGAGLENLGNTCFINAVLQCFTHTVPFVLGLRSLNHHQKRCDPDIKSFCLLRAIHDHIELSLSSSGGVVSPYEIFENLNYISYFFQRYEQEDAHEFMQCLLDKLQSCCSYSKTKNDLSISDDYLVKKVFGGRLVSRLCCCNCGHISSTYEPLHDLSLEIEDVDSLPSALQSFTKVEKIEDPEAKFRCENCKEEVSVEKQLMLDQAPSIATFHMKRFKIEGTFVEKIDKHVIFPLELDLQPYTIVDDRSNEELKYQLYAVVKHYGYGPTSGHYVCYIRSSPDTWHELNDSLVTSVEEEAVLSQEAYILLYARQGIPWFSTAIKMQKTCANAGISDSSPKSVLDNVERASNPQVENSADCGANESKKVADRTSTQFSCKTQFEVEIDEPCVAAKGISGVPGNESEFQVSMSINSRDDSPMTDASIPAESSNCSDEFDKNISTLSHIGQNNSNQGVDEATNDSGSTWTPSRYHRTDNCHRDSSGSTHSHLKKEKRSIHQRAVNRPAMDQGRIEALRYAKRMPTARGAKLMALLAPQTAGKRKKRTRSSPCKRVSPRPRQKYNLMHQVPVSR